MKVFQITNIKDFMARLLLSDLFDHFLLSEALIQTKVTYRIDGRLSKDFWSGEEFKEERLEGLFYAPFSLLRENCYDLIKGKKTPVAFRFVFLLSPDNLASTFASWDRGGAPENLDAVFLNLNYSGGSLTCTTGISYRIFSTDRSFEQYWDQLIPKFLSSHGVPFEEM